MKQVISDLDHFAILRAIKNKDTNFLKDFTISLKSSGIKDGVLVSDGRTKEQIKFPFEVE